MLAEQQGQPQQIVRVALVEYKYRNSKIRLPVHGRSCEDTSKVDTASEVDFWDIRQSVPQRMGYASGRSVVALPDAEPANSTCGFQQPPGFRASPVSRLRNWIPVRFPTQKNPESDQKGNDAESGR